MNQLISSFDEYLRLQRRRSSETAKCYVAVATSLIGFLPDAASDAEERLAQATTDELEYAPEREHIARSREVGQPTDGGPNKLSWARRSGQVLGRSCRKPGARQ